MISFISCTVYAIRKSNYIRQIPIIQRQYRFTMDIKLLGGRHARWTNIFRATATEHNCCSSKGDRIPAIFLRPGSNNTLHICNSINGRGNLCVNPVVPVNKFTHVTIQQVKDGDKYQYSILLDHNEIYSVVNQQARSYESVNVYMGDGYYAPADAVVKNYHFENLEECSH